MATKMLASLRRCRCKQVPFGRAGDPATQAGSTIFFAQPTADVPSMQLPPPPDAHHRQPQRYLHSQLSSFEL